MEPGIDTLTMVSNPIDGEVDIQVAQHDKDRDLS